MKKRIFAILVIFTIIAFALLCRTAYLQFVQGKELTALAYNQQNSGVDISPKRGAILDRNGDELAVNTVVETISLNPNQLRESIEDEELTVREVSAGLSEILSMDSAVIEQKIEKNAVYENLIKKIDPAVANHVREYSKEKKIIGIHFVEDSKRFYKNKNLAAHIIGMTGDDNQGLSGVEYLMERYIKGTPGKILGEVDTKKREVPLSNENRVDPKDGQNVVLTIDTTIQYFATKALEKAITDNNVREGGVIIIMDPRNGDILAMVSKPDFDLNNPYAAPPGEDPFTWNGRTQEGTELLGKTAWRNKAIMSTYEPGSTFKAITTSAGLEEGAITLDSNFYCEPKKGYSPKPIGCWKTGSHGSQDLTHAVYNSCNPAFMTIAQSMGRDIFYQYIRDFGFYDKTGITLPGEVKGIFHDKPKEVDMLVASFGQRFTITPIQLISAYSAIANGGNLMKPRLVKELTDANGNVLTKFEPEIIRKVISKETSDTMRTILEGVVSEGTGRNAYVNGFRIAGKTGTSQTVDEDRYIASFCSFAPADNPVVCALIILDSPAGEHMGGAIAAPVAQKLLEEVLTYLEVERKYSEQDVEKMVHEVYVPEVRNKTIEEAIAILKEKKLEYKLLDGVVDLSKTIAVQIPSIDLRVPSQSIVVLYPEKDSERMTVVMPDLTNKTIYEATDALRKLNLNIKITGSGVAKGQSVEAGEEVEMGSIVEVEFRHTDNIE